MEIQAGLSSATLVCMISGVVKMVVSVVVVVVVLAKAETEVEIYAGFVMVVLQNAGQAERL